RFLVENIAKIPCAESVSVLVETVLVDGDDNLRGECIEILQSFGRETAVQAFLARLVNRAPDKDDPTIYDRAGLALASLGDERCLPRLIDCLVTKHLRAPPPQPGYNVGQTSEGNVGYSQGQKKPEEERVQNQAVLTALTTI
ncbi:MAG: HEAT repeat domain-containing protein, partial [Pirellulaceae bacterium]